MADWTAPFHAPQLTDEKWREQKAKYVAERGYTIAIPGLSDIFHFSTPDPMTPSEEDRWKHKEWHTFSTNRLAELHAIKAKKRERYLGMLGSPTPDIVRNAGSILTAIDDAQDAISTLACIGRMAMRWAPRLIGKLFRGPTGWLLLLNDILNIIMTLGQLVTLPMMAKKNAEGITLSSPFSKKAKLKRALKLLKWVPDKADIIQGLQTTDQVFGVGICLGPIVGFAQDVAAGGVRMALGQKVKLKFPPSEPPQHEWIAQRAIKSGAFALANAHGTDEMMILEVLAANYLAHQVLQPAQQQWSALDAVENLDQAEILVPYPRNILTLEIIAEEKGPDPKDAVWPDIGKPWGNIIDVANMTQPAATENLKNFVDRNQSNWLGYAGGVLACEASTYTLANLESEEEVQYDYTAASKIAGNILQEGFFPDPEQPREKLDIFMNYMGDAEKYDLPTSKVAILAFCKEYKIKLLKIGDTA